MIRTFADKRTELVFRRLPAKRLTKAVYETAHEKLLLVNAAGDIKDLSVPPGNRLEKLLGDRKGQYSIRVNDQYRICFVWRDGHAESVELVDYH